MNPGELRRCPECHGPWPKEPDYALRGCGWLYDLPRGITPTNIDAGLHSIGGTVYDGQRGVELHDGGIAGERHRFLRLEFKTRKEKADLSVGQSRLLRALAALPDWKVLLLRGDTRRLDVRQVTPAGLSERSIPSHAEAVRRAIAAYLRGESLRDALATLGRPSAEGHVCGWARVDGVWTCVQDHYAVGSAPETSCGRRLPLVGNQADVA